MGLSRSPEEVDEADCADYPVCPPMSLLTCTRCVLVYLARLLFIQEEDTTYEVHAETTSPSENST